MPDSRLVQLMAEGDREAGGRERERPRLRRLAPGFALLAVAGEDEERVVDGDADPDHRSHVGDKDRGLQLQREEVDQRPGDEDTDEAERQRQSRRGEGAEDDEEDDRDDREPGPLGLGEIFLGDFLHPRPDRRLPDQIGRDAGVCRTRFQVFAQRRGGVDQLVGGEVAAQRHQNYVLTGEKLPPCLPGRRGGEGDVIERGHFVLHPRHRSRPIGRTRIRLRLQHHRDPVRLRAEVVLQRFAHLHRLAARNVEPAAGQVVRLFRGEGQGQKNDQHPPTDDPATAPAEHLRQ